MANSQLLKMRLFLEGLEVPVISASVTSAIGSPASAQIQIIGDPQALRLAPRTMVHLFIYDPRSKSKVSPKNSDGKYVLLFSGDLMSVSYQKTGASRNATLSCLDDSSYYDLSYLYFMSQRSIGRGSAQDLTQERAQFVGAMTGWVGLSGGPDLLMNVLNEVFNSPKPKSFGFKHLKGLPGAIVKLIEITTGVDDISKGGVNQFFSFHSRRKRLTSQLHITEDDSLAHNLLSSEFILEFIGKKSRSLGELITLRKLIKYILDFIYYSIVPCTSPKYTPAGDRIAGYVDSPVLLAIINRLSARLDKVPAKGKISDHIPIVTSDIDKADKETDLDIRELKAVAQNSTEAIKTSIEAALLGMKNNDKVSAILHTSSILTAFDSAKIVVQEHTSEKMTTTAILPELFFSVAPTCNVLYPDMYNSLSYNRQLSSEPTRLHLTTRISASLTGSTGGADELIYYAPSLRELTGVQSKRASSAGVSEIISSKLFDHEIHTGIIPNFSSVERLAFTAALVKTREPRGLSAEVKEAIRDLPESDLKSSAKFSDEERDEFFIRIANAQYVKNRLSKRRASVGGILNVYAAVGMPMIVIDGTPVTGKGDRFDKPGQGTDQNEHYVGLLTSMTHTVNQQTSGTTSYELSYVRPHRGKDDEFLSQLALTKTVSLVGAVQKKATYSAFKTLDGKADVSDDTLRDFAVLLGATTATGRDNTGQFKTPDGKSIVEPSRPGSFMVGSQVYNQHIRAVQVTDSNQAGGLKDVLGKDRLEQASYIRQHGGKAYVDEVITKSNTSVSPKSQRIMVQLLEENLKIDESRDTILACAEYANKVTGRFPITMFAGINVYYGNPNANEEFETPLEEMIRPRYVDDIYSSALVGHTVYEPMLGVPSVIDRVSSVADKLKIPKYKLQINPGAVRLGTSSRNEEVVSQENAVDILAYEYASNRGRSSSFSQKKVFRQIATLPDVLGSFHAYAWASRNSTKPIALVDDMVYDYNRQRCPDGYRKATNAEIVKIMSRINPSLDVREDRNQRVRKYLSRLKSRGMLG
jgi:hypothetical protein